MTDNDRSPSLSGESSDDLTGREPVISGVGSKLLADMRGAYLAGNVEGLLNLMDDDQQLAFKRWNVDLGLRKVRPVIHYFEEDCPDEPRLRRQVAGAEEWLQQPDSDVARRARSLAGRGWREEDRCAWVSENAAHASRAARLLIIYVATDDVLLIRELLVFVLQIHKPAWLSIAPDGRSLSERVQAHLQNLKQAKRMILHAQLRVAYIILGGNPFAVAGERRWYDPTD